jgi:hypothetical protein
MGALSRDGDGNHRQCSEINMETYCFGLLRFWSLLHWWPMFQVPGMIGVEPLEVEPVHWQQIF